MAKRPHNKKQTSQMAHLTQINIKDKGGPIPSIDVTQISITKTPKGIEFFYHVLANARYFLLAL